MRVSGAGIGVAAAAVVVVAAVGTVAVVGWDDLIEPLVGGGEEVPIEPLVPENEVPLEPLVTPDATPGGASVPPGTELAEAYRIEITNTFTAVHDVTISRDRQEGTESYTGDIVARGNGRYEGTAIATATNAWSQNTLGEECSGAYSGRQTVALVGIVREADTLPETMIHNDDPGGVYLALYATEPAGGVEWADPDDDCGRGVASEFLPVTYSGPELQSSAIGGAVVRLPPPGFGVVEERFDYEGPGLFGPVAYEWVFRVNPIDVDEAEEAEVTEGDPLEIPSLTGSFDLTIEGGADAGTYAVDLEDAEYAVCEIGILDELTLSYSDPEGEVSYLNVVVYELEEAENGTEAFELQVGLGESGEGPYVSPYLGTDEGTATLQIDGETAELEVTGESADGETVRFDATCEPLADLR